jgi:hypothetical protein
MFKKINEGNVVFTAEKNKVCGGPRVALLPDGNLACTYAVSSYVGANDFVLHIAYSKDSGTTWTEGKPIWPEFIGKKSIFASIRTTADGRVSLAGKWFAIDKPGESFWSDEAGGMKENQLIFSISKDGYSFPTPIAIDLPYYASAEQPGGMQVDADGTMTMIYAPYPTIEKKAPVNTNQMVMMRSADGGKSFTPSTFGPFEGNGTYAESWLVRLTDGRLLASSWLISDQLNTDVYFLSEDNGKTFKGPLEMDFKGQTTSLTPYLDNTVLIPYNQRKTGTIGVWLSIAKPDATGFHMIANEPVWQAEIATRNNTSGDFSEWTDYSFGEPNVTILPDGTFLLVLWYQQMGGTGIRYIHLRKEN